MLREMMLEYKTVFMVTCIVIVLYGCYCRVTANSKEQEKRLKGTIEAVVGAVGLLIAILIK